MFPFDDVIILPHVAGGENFALFRPASQSSTYQPMVASLAVDGNNVDDSSCTATDIGDYHPWWKVELDYPIWVTHVEITNRYGQNGGYQFI